MAQSVSPAGLDHLHQAMAARVDKGELPGMVVLAARGDDVRVDALGAMAFGGAEPMRRDTIFRIASMTKPVLAAATMMLVDDGTLGLDQPVDRWLPELANPRVLRQIDGPLDDTLPAARPITVEDLLTFRLGSGMLFEPTFDPPFPIVLAGDALKLVLGKPDPRTPHNPDEWIKRFGSLPLMYQPGERWQYSVGSLVLGVLVARAAGAPLEAVLEQHVFEPLGMHDTGFSLAAEHAARLPSLYMTNFGTGKLELVTASAPSEWTRPPIFPSGAGGLVSTADDFLAFGRLILNRGLHQQTRLLSEKSIDQMTTNHLTPAQIVGGGPFLQGSGWGFGMSVTVAPDDVSAVPGRYGWAGGYGTSWCNYPDRNLVTVVLTQTADFLWNGGLKEFDQLAAQL